MRFFTKTSCYQLAQTIDGKFVLTKVTISKGKHSMVEPGQSFIGDTITITGNGLEINTPEGMKTSPISLPIVNVQMVDGKLTLLPK